MSPLKKRSKISSVVHTKDTPLEAMFKILFSSEWGTERKEQSQSRYDSWNSETSSSTFTRK